MPATPAAGYPNSDFLWQMIDASPNYVFIKDGRGRFILVNEACADLYGLSENQMTGLTEAEAGLCGKDLARIEEEDKWVLEHNERLDVPPQEVVDLTGKTRHLQTVKLPISSEDGSSRWILGISTDVTQRVEAEQAAQEAARVARDLYDRAPCGYHTVDSRGMIVEINDTELEWLGYARDEVIGQFHVKDLLSMGSLLEFQSYYEQLQTIGFIRELEGDMRRKDGSAIPVIVNSRAMFDSDGAFLMARTTIFDNTVRHAAERAALAAKGEAERANRAKSEFLSRMSHELRTPLNSILGFAQLLEMKDLGDSERECARQILRGGRHLLKLINEVLDIARIESGHLGISIEPVELAPVIKEAVGLIQPIASASDIDLVVEEIDEHLFVEADRQRLTQVLLNLLSNAVKYNRECGRVTVSVSETSDSRVDIRICDTGKGVSPDDEEALFEPFARLDAGDLGIEGTGLGLALSRGLTVQMNGILNYEPNPQGGSVFSLKLAKSKTNRSNLEALPSVEADTDYRFADCLVLLIEDNKSNIDLMKRVLSARPKIKLAVAMQGKQGIELAIEHLPDLILLDVNLPDLSGEEVLLSLRRTKATRHIPILVTSADATPKLADKMFSLGATGYLTKPLDIPRLLSVVDRLLGEEQAAA